MEHKVTLVGAGPGDPELLTIKALRAIEVAEVVVYDRLVSDEIMALVPRGVPKIYAGKSCKHKAMPQEEINDLLVMLAKKYTRVVRLKGGDPFLFGRGGEEMLALVAAHIQCEIIPGITSAQGCATAAGIPLTHRGLATGVRFVTGHYSSPSPLLTSPLLGEETIVIYMGLTNIAEISANIIAEGLPASTPAAIIERGTTPKQRVFITTLALLPAMVERQKIEPPSLVIIGKVAALANVTELSHDFAAEYATMSGE
jgi:uroporphyrin-III C-methyltransferase